MMLLSIMATLSFEAATYPSPLPSEESLYITTWFFQTLPSLAIVESLESVTREHEAGEVTFVVQGAGGGIVVDALTKQDVAKATPVDIRGGMRYSDCSAFLIPMLCIFMFGSTLVFACSNKKKPTYGVATAVPEQTKILTIQPLQCRTGDVQTVVTV